jgi:hypothetical protein
LHTGLCFSHSDAKVSLENLFQKEKQQQFKETDDICIKIAKIPAPGDTLDNMGNAIKGEDIEPKKHRDKRKQEQKSLSRNLERTLLNLRATKVEIDDRLHSRHF